jgi:protein-S-isoprenylcysteine O-methyltransferase Ste14
MIAFWATPHMTLGHLLFAVVTTAYMALAAAKFEDPDLVEFHGDDYVQYRRSVRMFVPVRRKSGS